MRQAPGEAVQKLCPHCSTLAYTGDTHCPWCGGSYKRRLWPALLALLLVQTTLVLGGTALMLVVFGREAESRLDERVAEVERDLDASFDQVRRAVRQELDRRLPPAP
jgi:RNA polymerase subunit RPABC4/transcription elongation factor Spt4